MKQNQSWFKSKDALNTILDEWSVSTLWAGGGHAERIGLLPERNKVRKNLSTKYFIINLLPRCWYPLNGTYGKNFISPLEHNPFLDSYNFKLIVS